MLSIRAGLWITFVAGFSLGLTGGLMWERDVRVWVSDIIDTSRGPLPCCTTAPLVSTRKAPPPVEVEWTPINPRELPHEVRLDIDAQMRGLSDGIVKRLTTESRCGCDRACGCGEEPEDCRCARPARVTQTSWESCGDGVLPDQTEVPPPSPMPAKVPDDAITDLQKRVAELETSKAIFGNVVLMANDAKVAADEEHAVLRKQINGVQKNLDNAIEHILEMEKDWTNLSALREEIKEWSDRNKKSPGMRDWYGRMPGSGPGWHKFDIRAASPSECEQCHFKLCLLLSRPVFSPF